MANPREINAPNPNELFLLNINGLHDLFSAVDAESDQAQALSDSCHEKKTTYRPRV